jgi:hypothetical protein
MVFLTTVFFYWSLRREKMQIFSIFRQKITRIKAWGQSYLNKLQISRVWTIALSILLLWPFFFSSHCPALHLLLLLPARHGGKSSIEKMTYYEVDTNVRLVVYFGSHLGYRSKIYMYDIVKTNVWETFGTPCISPFQQFTISASQPT